MLYGGTVRLTLREFYMLDSVAQEMTYKYFTVTE